MNKNKSTAKLSVCKKYRYLLSRRVSEVNEKILCFIMLNPSTADAEIDDPTIRKCMGFCRELEYGRLVVVNLFDYRATDPKQLKKTSYPYSKNNIGMIETAASMSDMVICAWGTNGTYNRQNEKVLKLLLDNNITAHALEITKHGHPKHPLYISYNKKPIIYKEPRHDSQ